MKHTGTAKPSGSSTGVNGVILAEAPTGWAPLNRPPSEEVAMDSAETEGILITFFSPHHFLLRIINRIIFKYYWQSCFLYTCILTIFFSNWNSYFVIFRGPIEKSCKNEVITLFQLIIFLCLDFSFWGWGSLWPRFLLNKILLVQLVLLRKPKGWRRVHKRVQYILLHNALPKREWIIEPSFFGLKSCKYCLTKIGALLEKEHS